MISLSPFSTYYDQNQSDDKCRLSYPTFEIVIIQMQIGNLNNFGYNRIRMDQEGSFIHNLTENTNIHSHITVSVTSPPY